jgi:hypothetical protein
MQTWLDLVVKAPGLQRFEEEAREAAGNNATWWPSWLYGYGDFTRLLSDPRDRRAAYDHLKATYHGERQRLLLLAARHQPATSPPRPLASSTRRPAGERR